MQIDSINSYNTNFNGLHVSKQTLKAIGCTRKDLLRNPSIREAAEKYDVVIKAGNRDVDKFDPAYPMNTILRTMGTCMGVGIITALTLMATVDVASIGIIPCTLVCFIPTFATLWLNKKYDDHKFKPVKEIVIQAGKGVDANEDYIKNCETRTHVVDGTYAEIPLVEEVKEAENTEFDKKIKTYDTDDLFSAKKYLEALKKADIELLGGGDFFNRKIDEQGNTMLTQFFDVIPTEENEKEYKEILNILARVKGIDYNQKDGNGISCLEKIINSENQQVLPLIFGLEFDYSPEIEILYNHIQDEDFKYWFDHANLKFNFNDILKAVELTSLDTLKELRPQLLSPLCDRKRLARQIEKILNDKHANSRNERDYHAQEYVHKYYKEFVNPNMNIPQNER